MHQHKCRWCNGLVKWNRLRLFCSWECFELCLDFLLTADDVKDPDDHAEEVQV